MQFIARFGGHAPHPVPSLPNWLEDHPAEAAARSARTQSGDARRGSVRRPRPRCSSRSRRGAIENMAEGSDGPSMFPLSPERAPRWGRCCAAAAGAALLELLHEPTSDLDMETLGESKSGCSLNRRPPGLRGQRRHLYVAFEGDAGFEYVGGHPLRQRRSPAEWRRSRRGTAPRTATERTARRQLEQLPAASKCLKTARVERSTSQPGGSRSGERADPPRRSRRQAHAPAGSKRDASPHPRRSAPTRTAGTVPIVPSSAPTAPRGSRRKS